MSQEEWNKNTDDDVQMPLGTGGETPAEEYVSESGGSKINTSTLALIAAFAAGLIVLYLLGLQNKPRVATAEESERVKQTEERIRDLLSNAGDQQKINSMFGSNTTKLTQLLNDYFKRPSNISEMAINPFEPESAPTLASPTSVVPDDAKDAAELRAAADEFGKLKLQMVMMGSPPTAVINDKIMLPGQKLDRLLITDIKPDGVILMFKDKKYKLTPATDKDHK